MGKGATTCERPALDIFAAPDPALKLKSFKDHKPEPKYWGSVQRISNKGVETTLKFYEDIDDGACRGWKVELIEAHTSEGPAGYLKLAYIPKEHMKAFYPNPLAYAVRNKNLYYGLETLLDIPERQWSREDCLKALKASDDWSFNNDREKARQALSDRELKEAWKTRRRQLSLKHEKEYKSFRKFQEDKPYVDFIQVYQGARSFYQEGKRLQADGLTDQTRKGIGTLLYETGALWMKERGYPMFGSGLQSEEAQAVWEGFEKQGLTEKVGKRRRFNTEALIEKTPKLEGLLAHLEPQL